MPAYKMISYHCRNCGASTNPEKEYCDYCSGQLMLKRFIDVVPKRKKIRLLVDCGEDYINFDTIDVYIPQPPKIDVTTLEDDFGTHEYGRQEFKCIETSIILDKRSIFLLGKIQENDNYGVRIEYPYEDLCIEFQAKPLIQEFSASDIIRAKLSLVMQSPATMQNRIEPVDAFCPNCGAPVTSRYGCCDYCGGWVEWVW